MVREDFLIGALGASLEVTLGLGLACLIVFLLGERPRASRWSWIVKRQAVNVMGRIWLRSMYGVIVRRVRLCCWAV